MAARSGQIAQIHRSRVTYIPSSETQSDDDCSSSVVSTLSVGSSINDNNDNNCESNSITFAGSSVAELPTDDPITPIDVNNSDFDPHIELDNDIDIDPQFELDNVNDNDLQLELDNDNESDNDSEMIVWR